MNGNPFYVPPVIPDMSDQIMEFGKMAMQKDNLAQQRLLETQKLDSQEKYQTGMLENANKDTAIRQEEAYSKNPNIKPYSNGEYTKLLVQLRTAGIPTDKISFINGPLKEMAQNPDFKRGDVANMMEQKWPEIYNQTSEEVRNEILSLSKKTAGMSPMDPKYKEISGQIEKLGQFQTALDNIKNPKEIFFKDIYDYDQNSKAHLAMLRGGGNGLIPGQDAPQGAENMTTPELAKNLQLNPEALKSALLARVDDPKYTPYGRMGTRNNAKNTLFLNAFGNMINELGIKPEDLALASKDLKSDVKSYLTIKTDYDRTIQVVEQLRNFSPLLHEANDKYKRLGYPAPNKFWNWAQKNLSSPELAQFEMSLLAYSRDYMKVTTGAARSVAELTMGAQEKVDTILSRFDSWEVMDARIKQADKEVNGVEKSYNTQLEKIRGRIQGDYQGNPTTAPDTRPQSKRQPGSAVVPRKAGETIQQYLKRTGGL